MQELLPETFPRLGLGIKGLQSGRSPNFGRVNHPFALGANPRNPESNRNAQTPCTLKINLASIKNECDTPTQIPRWDKNPSFLIQRLTVLYKFLFISGFEMVSF